MEGKAHVLILPSLLYQTEYQPVAGIFQKHQADALAATGHRVGVVSGGLLPFAAALRPNRYRSPVVTDEGGVTVVRRYDKAWMPQRWVGDSVLAAAVVRLGMEAFHTYLKTAGRPDVLHVHDCLYAGLLARSIKTEHGIPYVVTEHSTMHQRGLYTDEQLKWIGPVLAEAAAVTAVGSGVMGKLRERYGDIPQVRDGQIIFNLLDGDFERTPPAPPQKAHGEPFVFLNVAHLVEQKEHLKLIEAMPAVLSQHPNVQLRIGGAGPMQPRLEQAIIRLGLGGHVKLLGLMNRPQVREQMERCDAFALSSRVETFGVVLIEAMAMGKPVIATVCGGPEDFVDEESGYLVPAGDVSALSSSMVQMIETADRFRPERIRDHCIERFGRDAFVQRLDSLYAQALAPAP